MSVIVDFYSPEFKKSLKNGQAYSPTIRVTEEYGKYRIDSERDIFNDHIVKCYVDGLGQKQAACSCEAGQFGRYCQHIGPVAMFHRGMAAAKKAHEAELEEVYRAAFNNHSEAPRLVKCAYPGCMVMVLPGREFCFMHKVGSRVGEKFSSEHKCSCHSCGRPSLEKPGYMALVARGGWYYHSECLRGL